MKSRDKLTASSGLRRGLFAALTVLGFGGLLSGQAMAADPVPNYDPALVPSNAYQFRIQGCDLGLDDGTYAPIASLICKTDTTWPVGGKADAYEGANLGKFWEELDLVPHRFGSDSTGADGTETYQVIVGADNLVNPSTTPPAIGYDRVVKFVFNDGLSTGSASDCVMTEKGGNSIGDFGIGGADTQIVQVLEITQTKDTTCVWDYVQRLAIGASQIPGSSTRSFIAAGAGEQSVPLPSFISPQSLSKTMTAVEDSLIKWTIAKTADPLELNFGDTCDSIVPNTANVGVTIDFTKGAAEPFAVTVTSMVNAENPSSRDVIYACTDMLYGIVPPATTESLLDTKSKTEPVASGEETFDIVHDNTPAGVRSLRNELSCDLFVKDVLGGSDIKVGTLTAAFSLDDNDIADGTVVNQSVVVSDKESISGTGFKFKTGDPTGATGAFTGYTPGTLTTGPVLWDSDPQSATGSIVFTKNVQVDRFITTSGELKDTASLTLSQTTDVSADAKTTFTASPKVNLTIKKTIPNILQGTETIACNFTVKDSGGDTVATPVFNFAAGETFKQTTLKGLDPDSYIVKEGFCGGLLPVGSGTQTIILDLKNAAGFGDCSADATFSNAIPGDGFATAEVNKVTMPAALNATDLGDAWEMTLTGDTDGDGQKDDVSIVLNTADSDQALFEPFIDSGTGLTFLLPEGDYMVTETLKIGWTNTTSDGCTFSVDYPADFGKTFQCQYTNKQLGKVIIEKQTIPDGETDFFAYTQDVDASGGFSLKDDGLKVFTGVMSNDPNTPYEVTETDPTPLYDLTDLTCTDDFDGNDYNVNSSSGNKSTGIAMINVDPGETVKCVYTNTKRGMVRVLKTVFDLVDPNQSIAFTLSGPGVNATDNTFGDVDGILEFGMAKLIPGETYTLCEEVPAAWSSFWMYQGQIVIPYNPDAPTQDLGTRCFDFIVEAGQTVSFMIDNEYPGGEARTPGYWKNWNRCTNGRQAANADRNGGADNGFFLMEDVLPQTIGLLEVDTCAEGVAVLDARDLTKNKKRSNDAAYTLARNLLAAQLNWAAGAGTCAAAQTAAVEGQALLVLIKFDGTGSYLKPKPAKLLRSVALQLAHDLDEYNNNRLCP